MNARAAFAEQRIDAEELREVEDIAIAEVVALQEDIGLQSATDGEFRRTSWHMDFIYQLGGISKTDEQLQVAFKNAEGSTSFTSAALKVSGPVTVDRNDLWRRLHLFAVGDDNGDAQTHHSLAQHGALPRRRGRLSIPRCTPRSTNFGPT